jgi:hypothetical protein
MPSGESRPSTGARRPLTTRQMSDAHEVTLAKLLDGRRATGSGNQFNDQMDGRNQRYDQPYALAWDGKSTLGKSVGVSREMWLKAQQQAGGETPMLALRWYVDERLTVGQDLVVLDLHDFVEILEAARRWEVVKECLSSGHETNPALHPQGVATSCWRCDADISED